MLLQARTWRWQAATTHVFSDVPEDTHVFLVLTRQSRVPEIVVVHTYMYTIDVNGKITVQIRLARLKFLPQPASEEYAASTRVYKEHATPESVL